MIFGQYWYLRSQKYSFLETKVIIFIQNEKISKAMAKQILKIVVHMPIH
jgi:hypothetical protein